MSDSHGKLAVQIVAICNRFDNLIQDGAPGPDGIQKAVALLADEVRANGWDMDVHAKLAELTKSFGTGLFTEFAPECSGQRSIPL
jgi:hypothetical protein